MGLVRWQIYEFQVLTVMCGIKCQFLIRLQQVVVDLVWVDGWQVCLVICTCLIQISMIVEIFLYHVKPVL